MILSVDRKKGGARLPQICFGS